MAYGVLSPVQESTFMRSQTVMTASRILRSAALGAVLMAGSGLAQHNEPQAGGPAGNGTGMMNGNMHEMMAMHSQMMADMKAMDASLDQKVAAMNAARGQAKVNAIAAVINEMVSHQKQMMAKMATMHDHMMGMKDTKTDEAPSTDPHKDHHE